MVKRLKCWYEDMLNRKYNNQFVDVPEADFKYPPPSAYEVKQIAIEYDLFHTTQNCNVDINKELTNGNR
jgi:hypothetical protein